MLFGGSGIHEILKEFFSKVYLVISLSVFPGGN